MNVIACKRDSDSPPAPPTPAPVVNSISPLMGLPGDTITIKGSNFSANIDKNMVKVGGIASAVISASDTMLTVTVPDDAVTGKITVVIANQSASSTEEFEVLKDIPWNALVAWYPFSGNADDGSVNGFNLSLYGTYQSAADRFGIANHAYHFNGGNSYGTTFSSFALTAPLTVACWVKYDSLIASTIVTKYASAKGFMFYLYPNGRMSVSMDGGVATSSATGIMPMDTEGEWIFVAFTYDGSTVKFYKNNAVVDEVAATSTITAAASIGVRVGLSGSTSTGPEGFKCYIDDVAIYERVLSEEEMGRLYEQTVGKK